MICNLKGVKRWRKYGDRSGGSRFYLLSRDEERDKVEMLILTFLLDLDFRVKKRNLLYWPI